MQALLKVLYKDTVRLCHLLEKCAEVHHIDNVCARPPDKVATTPFVPSPRASPPVTPTPHQLGKFRNAIHSATNTYNAAKASLDILKRIRPSGASFVGSTGLVSRCSCAALPLSFYRPPHGMRLHLRARTSFTISFRTTFLRTSATSNFSSAASLATTEAPSSTPTLLFFRLSLSCSARLTEPRALRATQEQDKAGRHSRAHLYQRRRLPVQSGTECQRCWSWPPPLARRHVLTPALLALANPQLDTGNFEMLVSPTYPTSVTCKSKGENPVKVSVAGKVCARAASDGGAMAQLFPTAIPASHVFLPLSVLRPGMRHAE